MKRLSYHKLMVWLAVALCVGQVALVLLSWIITAAMPETFSHSLLSAEGIRWFMGGFMDMVKSYLLVAILLFGVALGALDGCGIISFDKSQYRQRIAMRVVLFELVVFVAVMLALTVVPHAILLNVMGGLSNSSFTHSLIPYVCFSLLVMSVSYGVMSDRWRSLEDVFEGACRGIRLAAPLLLIYILAVQFVCSLLFLFS